MNNKTKEGIKLDMFSLSKNKKKKGNGEGNWITSYADIVTLLLVFFMVIASTSKMSQNSFEKMQKSLNNDHTLNALNVKKREIDNILKKDGLQEMVEVVEDIDGMNVIVKDNMLFASGSATIDEVNIGRFLPIAKMLGQMDSRFHFQIEGHTDSLPYTGTKFSSNWELSTERALSVLNIFAENGVASERLSIHGFGPYHPLVKAKNGQELTADQMAQNRRVVIKIHQIN